MTRNNPVIVALDVNSTQRLRELVTEIGDACEFYKVGMELYYSAGQETVTYLKSQGKEVFLDLKLHDIPNTVAQGTASLTRLGVSMISLHAAGGQSMMAAAVQAADAVAKEIGCQRPKLVAITVLTSLNSSEWQHLNCTLSIAEQVVNLALLAKAAGMDGVVASPHEAAAIRQACGADFLIVTPGIRPANTALNDQSRTATPSEAIANGADYLVIGRPITAAADKQAAINAILEQVRETI